MGGVAFRPIRLLEEGDATDGFSSGNAANDAWLATRARRAMREGTARVYVLTSREGELCGYYTLSTHAVARTADVAGNLRRNSPDPIPCTLLGQLAVDARFQGMSAGARLLQDAIRRAAGASKVVASRALVVDAANDDVRGFYEHFGFRSLDGGRRLFVRL